MQVWYYRYMPEIAPSPTEVMQAPPVTIPIEAVPTPVIGTPTIQSPLVESATGSTVSSLGETIPKTESENKQNENELKTEKGKEARSSLKTVSDKGGELYKWRDQDLIDREKYKETFDLLDEANDIQERAVNDPSLIKNDNDGLGQYYKVKSATGEVTKRYLGDNYPRIVQVLEEATNIPKAQEHAQKIKNGTFFESKDGKILSYEQWAQSDPKPEGQFKTDDRPDKPESDPKTDEQEIKNMLGENNKEVLLAKELTAGLIHSNLVTEAEKELIQGLNKDFYDNTNLAIEYHSPNTDSTLTKMSQRYELLVQSHDSIQKDIDAGKLKLTPEQDAMFTRMKDQINQLKERQRIIKNKVGDIDMTKVNKHFDGDKKGSLATSEKKLQLLTNYDTLQAMLPDLLKKHEKIAPNELVSFQFGKAEIRITKSGLTALSKNAGMMAAASILLMWMEGDKEGKGQGGGMMGH
jgi:hypothetical protein